ncbi:hypothetical protein SAMN05216338_104975 [Bradyrhizobium sp. Rc2d]|uniref:hypothetical protein n=1 Tax=Bradyrhizobium sp. Rc2d TaxID=1855321 RepID=UPI0008891B31|nr:hypothetical protein [Bradyrhizobium sp. Rc2d]SDJ44066.1 hypothetical protein SAMN05216338_104975 [Bradyrhizobium sp. Rc2d]
MHKYQVDLVNPKTSEEQTITVALTDLERARAKRSGCWMSAVQDLARPAMPVGFMPIGNRVRAA